MSQPPREKPSLKEYIIEHWNNYKEKSILDVKKELKDICLIPSDDDLKIIQTWFRNKKKIEKSKSKILNQSQELQNNNNVLSQADLAQQIYVQQIDKLLQNILVLEKNEKLLQLKKQIDVNPYLLMDFMQNRQNAPTVDFLDIIVQICYQPEMKVELQTKLFVRVCALHKTELLNTTEQLLQNALVELSSIQTDQNAAYGLLKLAYQNDITFVNFPIDSLMTFQSRYHLVFQRFYNYLSQDIDFQVINCLPPTCFIFTQPFYQILKEGGYQLHQNVTPQYLTFLINLLAYSFENNEHTFEIFLNQFKQGCLLLYGMNIDIIPIIDAITQEEIFKNPKFFGKLDSSIKLFQHLFEMIKEQKITIIDQNLINDLIQVNDQDYKQRSLQPRQINSNKEYEIILQQYIKLFSINNESLQPLINNMQFEVDHQLNKLEKLFKINQMNQVQFISTYIMESLFQQEKLFQEFETGIGKTTLSLIIMLHMKQRYDINSLTIYQQEELCFRDFTRVQEIASGLNMNCIFINSIDQIQFIANSQIIFITDKIFQSLTKNEEIINIISNYLFIMDEFDSILFDENISSEQLSIYNISKYLIGFTGSKLENIHLQVLNKHFNSSYIKYPLAENIDGSINQCRDIKAFSQRNEQLACLQQICNQQSLKTPILLIIDQQGQQKFTEINKKTLNFKDLTKMNCIEIESYLKNSFLKQNNGSYQICFITNKQGRGIDIPTNQEIEQNGGISIIIAQLPQNSREFEQLKGRTKRMSNKGQYFVILWNKTKSSNENCLEEQLDIAKKQEQLKLNQLLISLSPKKQQQFIDINQEINKMNNDVADLHIQEEEEKLSQINEEDGIQQEKANMNINNTRENLSKKDFIENQENQVQTNSSLSTKANTRAFASIKNFRQQISIPKSLSKRIKEIHQIGLKKFTYSSENWLSDSEKGSKRKIKEKEKSLKFIQKQITFNKSEV